MIILIGVLIAVAIACAVFAAIRICKNRKDDESFDTETTVESRESDEEKSLDSLMDMVNNQTQEPVVTEAPSTEKKEEPAMNNEAPMNIQDIIDASRAVNEIRSAEIDQSIPMVSHLEDVVVEDDPAMRRIRTTKIKLLIKTLQEKLVKISPKIFKDLLTYDPNGFTFCRWKIEEKDGLYTDTNRLERYSLLDMIRNRILFTSIDFIVYGKESIMVDDEGNVNMDPAWWNFTHSFLIHPASFNIGDVMAEVFSDKTFSFLISSDCLLTIMDDILNTESDTASFRSTLEYRASDLKTDREKDAARVLNDRFQDVMHPERLVDKRIDSDTPKGTGAIQEVISVESNEEPVTIEGDIRHA